MLFIRLTAMAADNVPRRHRKIATLRFRRFAVLVAALSFAGLVTYAVFPAAPPWMAGEAGLMGHVTRIIPLVWGSIGLHSAGTLWPRERRWLRPLVAAYPLMMGFSLVFGAEHFGSTSCSGGATRSACWSPCAMRCAAGRRARSGEAASRCPPV